MFKQDFSDFYKVYSAVHDNKLREEVKSQRDEISEMDLSLFSDKDLFEIAEEVVQELFEKGYKIEDVSVVLSDDTSSSFRKDKLRRINEALDLIRSLVFEGETLSKKISFGPIGLVSLIFPNDLCRGARNLRRFCINAM